MTLFFICFEKSSDDLSLSDLLTHLDLLGAKQVLKSVWALKSNDYPLWVLTDILNAYLIGDNPGRLLIIEAPDLKWAAVNTLFDINELSTNRKP